MRGKLVTVEGIDGAGKTLLIEGLLERLIGRGCRAVVVREPGGTYLSEKIRTLLLDPQSKPMSAGTEAMLYAAARAQLVEEVIRPALEAGELVLCDRFTDSTLAYQGGGRGLDTVMLSSLNRLATGGIVPYRTILLDIDPLLGRRRRLAGRGMVEEDRLESEGLAFYQRVRQVYLDIARSEPERVRLVEAALPPAQVLENSWEIIEGVLSAYESERNLS